MRPPPARAYLDSPVPLAIAHRGFSLDGLENSLTAFRAAVGLGYSYLETDINTTADGVTVVFHDPSLDRITDRGGLIAELPYAVVRRALIGGREPIATLPELLRALPEAHFNIDVKDAASVAPLAAAIEEFGLHERVCVASFSDRRRLRVLALLSRPVASAAGKPGLAAFALLGPWLPRPLVRLFLPRVDVLAVPPTYRGRTLVTRRFVARAHRMGLRVQVWTVDDPAHMHRLLDLGVDGIMTDRADLLAAVMRERGYWP
ncbi:glycerophosphodiester phosphodiesterase family protein [Specibacter sp. RAF43]|uniref:glycerophosphodiester phosphodiesterase family protein n=1 Tax=Specibacter sp. RAF43 TaxID=3233057 RepID=UPI003F9E79E5